MNKRETVGTVLLFLLLMVGCVGLGAYYTYQSITPETEYVAVRVPFEVVKEVQVIEIVTVEVPTPFPVYVYNTTIIEVPVSMPLNDWQSEEELMSFIKRDKTDRILYSTDFDCDDFALRTIHNAAEIGRRVYYFYEWRDNGNRHNNHIMCMAYVKAEALYVIWEPQTDAVWSTWSSTVGG